MQRGRMGFFSFSLVCHPQNPKQTRFKVDTETPASEKSNPTLVSEQTSNIGRVRAGGESHDFQMIFMKLVRTRPMAESPGEQMTNELCFRYFSG